ncbi:MAG: hypothetical protein ABL911_04990 [Gallionella sp.]
MGFFTEKQIDRYLRSLSIAAIVSVYWKLRDTLIADEWVDLLEDFVFVFLTMTFLKWLWFRALGADKRAEERQREQDRSAAASLDGASSSGGLGSTRSQNSPDNL